MKVSAAVWAIKEIDGGWQMHALEAAATGKIGDEEMSLRAYLDAEEGSGLIPTEW